VAGAIFGNHEDGPHIARRNLAPGCPDSGRRVAGQGSRSDLTPAFNDFDQEQSGQVSFRVQEHQMFAVEFWVVPPTCKDQVEGSRFNAIDAPKDFKSGLMTYTQ
jgi:hypothetical protein